MIIVCVCMMVVLVEAGVLPNKEVPKSRTRRELAGIKTAKWEFTPKPTLPTRKECQVGSICEKGCASTDFGEVDTGMKFALRRSHTCYTCVCNQDAVGKFSTCKEMFCAPLPDTCVEWFTPPGHCCSECQRDIGGGGGDDHFTFPPIPAENVIFTFNHGEDGLMKKKK